MARGFRVHEPERSAPGPLADLLAKLWPTLVAWAHGRLPSFARHRADTEDLVGDAVVAALKRSNSMDPEKPGMVVRFEQLAILNRIRDEIRWSRRVEAGSGGADAAIDPSPSPMDHLLESEDRRRFRKALLQLRLGEQLLIVGRVELHLSYAHLARATGLPSAEAARSATRRALLRLAHITGALALPRPGPSQVPLRP